MIVTILDRENLDNPLFLKSFAESFKKMNPVRSIILHSDSAYTDRIISTGVSREKAVIRSIQDINHRLINFFADYGLACIGVNGFQKETVVHDRGKLTLNTSFIDAIPDRTILVLSALVHDAESGRKVPVGLAELAQLIGNKMDVPDFYAFSTDKKSLFMVNPGRDKEISMSLDKINILAEDIGYPLDLIGFRYKHYVSKPIFNNSLNRFETIAVIDPDEDF